MIEKYKFQNLSVYQLSLDYIDQVYSSIIGLPDSEKYNLSSQIKRTATSIALNIAEGSTGQSNAEFRQFIGYAIRSAVEVVSCLYLAKKRDIIKHNKFQKLYIETEIIVKMLQALRKAMR